MPGAGELMFWHATMPHPCNVAAADGGAGVVVARRAENCRIRRDAASEGREQRDEVMRALEVGRR